MPSKPDRKQDDSVMASSNGSYTIDNTSLAELVEPGKDVLETEVQAVHLDLTTPSPAKPPTGSRYNDFVLTDDDENDEETEPILTKCPARKPGDFDVFRVRADRDWSIEAYIVEYRGENKAVPRGFYLIHPRLKHAFGKKGRKHLIVTCVNTNGSMFLWPIKLTEGFGDSWCKSALRIVETAKEKWVKDFRSDGNGYDADASKRDHGQPRWLGETLDNLLDMAFDGRIIRDRTHPLCDVLEIE